MTHILNNVLNLSPQSSVHRALEREAIFTPIDLVTMDNGDFDELLYIDDDGELMLLPKGYAGLLKAFQAFVLFKKEHGTPLKENTWVTLQRNEFNEFKLGPNFDIGRASPLATLSSSQTFSDPLETFRRGIKRDISHFVILINERAWDSWQKTIIAHACSQDISEILDPSFKPKSLTEKLLFDEKQKYMYAVF